MTRHRSLPYHDIRTWPVQFALQHDGQKPTVRQAADALGINRKVLDAAIKRAGLRDLFEIEIYQSHIGKPPPAHQRLLDLQAKIRAAHPARYGR